MYRYSNFKLLGYVLGLEETILLWSGSMAARGYDDLDAERACMPILGGSEGMLPGNF